MDEYSYGPVERSPWPYLGPGMIAVLVFVLWQLTVPGMLAELRRDDTDSSPEENLDVERP